MTNNRCEEQADLHAVLIKKERLCCGCGACKAVCPAQCIVMQENSEGFLYPKVYEKHCIHCNKCQYVCPALRGGKHEEKEDCAWGAYTTDKNILRDSSSGGIFSLLAMEIFHLGGCVFGAAFSDNFSSVEHIITEDKSGLTRIRTSKYIQSNINGAYQEVKKQLDAGRKVLFSGTPCQIVGLKNYLDEDDPNLLCVDVICHGVPSPKVWRTYLETILRRYGGVIESVNFRHKKNGWKRFGMNKRRQGKVYYRDLDRDAYLQMFLKNVCLRESCYQCFAKGSESVADLTIGDFWGVENVSPDMNNPLGTSLILVHTPKGVEWFNRTAKNMVCQEVDKEAAIRHNTAYVTSVRRPDERDRFFEELDNLSWKKIAKQYGNQSIKHRIRQQIMETYRALKCKARSGSRGGELEYGLMIQFCRKSSI